MKRYRYAQILYGKVHWICESEEPREFPPNLEFVEITDKTEVQERWNYDETTGKFTAPSIPEPVEPIDPQPTVEEIQAQTLLNTEYLISKSDLLGGM